jgi:hypothetical protein
MKEETLHGVHTISNAIVPDGRHTTVAALVEFIGIFLPPSFYQDTKANDRFLPCLQDAANALPSMALMM